MILPDAARLALVHQRVRERQYSLCATCYKESTKELALLIPYTDDTLSEYGAEVLKARAAEVRDIDQRILDLAAAMARTMHQAPGIGLAAPQVGESLRLITVDLSVGEDPGELLIVINPRVVEAEGHETSEEGCLSVPGYSLPIKRSARLLLLGTLPDGRELRAEFDGLKARVLQHEIDHLDGVTIVDRVSTLKRSLIRKEISQKRKSGEW